MTDYTIVIPAYNEEQVIGKILDELGGLQGCREMIVVDDGSSDQTAAIARSGKVKVISHPCNRGYGAALKTGIRAVSSEFVVICDADGQHRLEDILAVIGKMESYDLVIGARTGPPQDWVREPWRKLLGWFVDFLLRQKIPDFNSGLRAFRTAAIKKHLHLMPDGFSMSTTSTVAMIKMGYRVQHVPVTVREREGRKSSVRIFRDGFRVILLILNLIVLFEPERVFLPSAIFFMLLSIVYFIVYSIQIRVHVTASMVMLFLTGVILFFLGIVCEQISAIRREMNKS